MTTLKEKQTAILAKFQDTFGVVDPQGRKLLASLWLDGATSMIERVTIDEKSLREAFDELNNLKNEMMK